MDFNNLIAARTPGFGNSKDAAYLKMLKNKDLFTKRKVPIGANNSLDLSMMSNVPSVPGKIRLSGQS